MSMRLGVGLLGLGLAALIYWGGQVHANRIEAAIRTGADAVALTTVHPLQLHVSGRDIRVSGYVDDLEGRDRVLAALNDVTGRRVVVDNLIVLPRAEPFTFGARKAGDEVTLEGHVPTGAARMALAEQVEAEPGDLKLASGAPLGWTQSTQIAVEALMQLNGGALEQVGTDLTLRGTAETPAEKATAEAILAALPDSIAITTDIDIRDDGTLPFAVRYDAADGVAVSGHLPKGFDPAQIARALGVDAATGEHEQSGVANDRIEDLLLRLAGWLPEMDRLTVANGDDGLRVEAQLLPGTDRDLITQALADLPAQSVSVAMTDREVSEGTRRTNAASGLDEIFSGGFWLPDMRFDANVATCTKKARDVLSAHKINFVTGSARLDAKANRAINAMAAVVRTCTQKAGLRAELGGHTDATGDQNANLELSLRRAEAVGAALVARGVPRTAITAQGYGASRPIASNATEDGRAANRRTTVKWSQ